MVAGFLPVVDGLDEFLRVDSLGVADAIPDIVTGLAEGFKAFLELLDAGVGRQQFILGVSGLDGVVEKGEGVGLAHIMI
jgi:hypothetical protein